MKRSSVVFLVPAYNTAESIPNTLESILQQECEGVDKRIIVIDDGSTDATVTVTADFVATHSGALNATNTEVEILENDHGGEAAALNRGLKHVFRDGTKIPKSDFIGIVESDVFVEPDWLSHCLDALKEEGVAGAGGVLSGIEGETWIARLAAIEVEVKQRSQPDYPVHITSANALYHTWAFERVGIFEEELYNASLDADFNGRLLEAGYRLRIVREAKARHAYKTSLGGYLSRYYFYGRYRAQVRQGMLYPADRWVALLVILTALSYAALPLLWFWPLCCAGIWIAMAAGNLFWTVAMARVHPDSALWIYPIVLFLRNTFAITGLSIGLIRTLISSSHD